MKTLLKLTLSTTAKVAGYAYGYSSVYAKFSSACASEIAEREINSELEAGIKSEKDKKKKGK